MSIPGALLPYSIPQYFNGQGQPLANGSLNFFLSGTNTPQDVCADPGFVTSLGVTVALDATGRPENASLANTQIFLRPLRYKVVLQDSLSNVIWTADPVFDVGSLLLGSLGTSSTAGGKSVGNGYNILPTDQLVTVNSSAVNPTVVNLPKASTVVAPNGLWLVLKNVGSNPVSVTPNGTDTIDGLNAVKSLSAMVGTTEPTFWLACDGVSAWFILAAYGTSASPGFGTWSSAFTVGTVYQAATDGIVMCTLNVPVASGQISTLTFLTDGSNPPTTVRQQAGGTQGQTAPGQQYWNILCPVRKGDYWKITETDEDGTPSSVLVMFLPLGS